MQFFTTIMMTWNNGDDDHVEHVVEQQRDADSHKDKLALVLWLLVTKRMCKMMTEKIIIKMVKNDRIIGMIKRVMLWTMILKEEGS